jgi:hypothetical protein
VEGAGAAVAPSALSIDRICDNGQRFDAFLMRAGTNTGTMTAAQKTESSTSSNLTGNKLEINITVQLISPFGVGEAIGTINLKNGEIVVAG